MQRGTKTVMDGMRDKGDANKFAKSSGRATDAEHRNRLETKMPADPDRLEVAN